MAARTILSKDFRVAIPKAMCEALGWQPSQKLTLILQWRGILLEAMVQQPS